MSYNNNLLPKRTVYKAGSKNKFLVEKPDTHCFSQVVKVKVNSGKSCWPMCPRYVVMRIAVCLCGLPSQDTQLQSNTEKNIKQILKEGESIKHPTSLPQAIKVIKNKESWKNCHRQEDLTET